MARAGGGERPGMGWGVEGGTAAAGPPSPAGVYRRLEPRTRVICSLAFIVCVNLVPADRNLPFALLLVILAAVLAASRVHPIPLLKRVAWLGPFVLAAVILLPFLPRQGETAALGVPLGRLPVRVYRSGLLAAKGILIKSLLSSLSAAALVWTTPFPGLGGALERLGFPRLLLLIISFLGRYLFLLREEFARIVRAARARNWESGRLRLRLKAAGGVAGSLLLRTWGRGERIYAAMLARGYDGTFPSDAGSRLDFIDFLFMGLFLPAVGAVGLAALLRLL